MAKRREIGDLVPEYQLPRQRAGGVQRGAGSWRRRAAAVQCRASQPNHGSNPMLSSTESASKKKTY